MEGLQEFGDWPAEDSLQELASLVRTAGAAVGGSLVLRLRQANPATLVGSGQLARAIQTAKSEQAGVLVFDAELAPRQQRNIERAFGGKVLDRTAVILDIFAARASSVEGRLQVERAQLEYLLPRLSDLWVQFSRQRGGIGPFRGPGETQIETDRRLYRDRMAELNRRLDGVRRERAARRRRRREAGLVTAALVGYTNAGKSSLLNALTDADVAAEDKLFVTLDPTTRKMSLPDGGAVLLTDTVGFIQRLPTRLIQAFRATLEESLEAQLLVHVIDMASPHFTRQADIVEKTLEEIGVGPRPVVSALNKADIAPVRDLDPFPNAVAVSALTGAGLDQLRARLAEIVQVLGVDVAVRIPYGAGDLVNLFHQQGAVRREVHESGGTRIEGTLPPALLRRYREYVVEPG